MDNPWKNLGIRGHHFWRCPECRNWLKTETCKNSNGKVLNCTNPGTCATCGVVYTKDNHILKDGKCINCGIQFVTYSAPTYDYAADGTSVTVKFTVTPKDATVVQLKPAYHFAPNMITKQVWTVTKSGTKYVCTGIFTFNQKTNVKAKPYMDNVCTQINGIKCYSSGNMLTVARDHTAPVISVVNQTDQKTSNGYATIKKLDISGTEDISEYVKLSIIDKATNKAVVNQAMVNVAGKKWAYSCTPPLEAGVEGRTYTVKTEDIVGNVSSKDFTIYKTDSSAPQVESSLSYTDWTNTAKTITLTITDYGSGSPHASLDNQTSYKSCIKTSDGNYQITYTFSDNISGTKDHDLYLKDALGNAQKVVLTVGNIDKNKYTITYSLNNGSIKGQKTSYTVVDSFTLPAPTRTGYTFTGWTGSNGNTPQTSVTIKKGSMGNKLYKANWRANKLIVTYNQNGGIINKNMSNYSQDINSFSQEWQYNHVNANGGTTEDPINFSSFGLNRTDGYIRRNGAEWNTKPDGTGRSYDQDKSYTMTEFAPELKKGDVSLVLYAQWKIAEYDITYDLNGGLINNQPTKYNVNTSTFILPTPTRTGYTFNGWTGSNGKTPQKSVSIAKGTTGNKSYTANWTPTNYTIGYTLNGGSISGQPTNYNIESANFTLPTPSKSGYTFTGWTGTGLSGLTKTVTVSKGSTGNRTYTAHFEKTVTATFKYYNNQTVTVTGKITDSATSVAVKAPAASGTPSGYTFRGWSTSSAANASVNAAASANVTISANVTYYASYSKNVTATFYYCALAADNYTYANGAQKSVTASATQYFGYTGTVVNSNISIPSTVTASHGGASAQNYVGVSKDTNSVSTVTPTTACTKYYAVYTEPLKFYYYNGTTDTSTSVTRRMLSNGSTYSNSLSTSAPTPAAYDGAAFAWWSYDSGVSGSSSLRKPLETGVNSLYAVYKKNVNISYNANGGSGEPAAQSGIKYYAKKESGSNIANPSITVTGSKPSRGGYNFSSWNTSANGNGTVYKAGAAYAISANVTLYAQWSYNSVSVKIPQILIANHAGTSQFRVKCDDLKAGNIKITVPNSFPYKQTGKVDVTATITSKSGNNIITPSNKVCVYNITTTNGLSAGCWSGSFNIGLTLTKE